MLSLWDWLRPEARLLLGAARRDPAPATLLALIGPDFDWRMLEAFAQRQFATATLYRRLQALPPNAVPGDVMQRLSAAGMVGEFRQRCLERALGEAVATLAGVGVQPLLLKGAALAVTVYPAFTDRGMVDLDLMVPPDQEDRAWNALLEAGWVPTGSEQMRPFFDQHHHRVPLVAPWLGHARLELHTRLFHGQGPFAFTADDLWRDASTVTVAGKPVLVPSSDHSLLYLCMHFAWSHALARGLLRALQDLEMLRQATGDVDVSFARVARNARAASCCYWTLRFAQRLFDLPISEALLAELRPPRTGWMLDVLERHFAGVAGLAPSPCPSVWLEQALWSLGVQPGWSGHGAARPWTAGDEWIAVAPGQGARDDHTGFWYRKRKAVTALRRYATALLR